jgi:hypothetical protein
MNILLGQGKLNIGSKLINLASAGDTIKAGLVTLANATGKVAKIASSTNATPIQITTSAPHGYTTGDIVVIGGHATNTAANGTWQIGAAAGSTYTLLTRQDGVNSTGNGVGGATGYCVDITTAATAADFGSAGGSNSNGTDISITGQSLAAFGIWNASAWTWTGLVAVPVVGIVLYDSTAGNDGIAWIDGTQQIYVGTQAVATNTAIAVNRLSAAIANGTVIVFSDGSTATLTAQANVGDTSLTVSSLAGTVHRQATADVLTFNTVTSSTAGLPMTPGAGGSLTFTPDTGPNKIFQL